MHMCCAPCSVYPASLLLSEGIEFDGLFFNPNIHPIDEFEKRKENVEIFCRMKNINVEVMDDYLQEKWELFDGEEAQRCNMCYSVRLDKTARYALEKGYSAFTTSLLVSPYQKHDLIKSIGEKCAEKYGINFYYRDFRPGFRQGQAMAKEMGLYRQKYCGCILSKPR